MGIFAKIYVSGFLIIYGIIFIVMFILIIYEIKQSIKKKKETKYIIKESGHHQERIYPVPFRDPKTQDEIDDFSKIYGFLFRKYNLDTIREVYTIFYNTILESNFGKDASKDYFEWWAKEKITDLIINQKLKYGFILSPILYTLGMLTSNDGSDRIYSKEESEALIKRLADYDRELQEKNKNQD